MLRHRRKCIVTSFESASPKCIHRSRMQVTQNTEHLENIVGEQVRKYKSTDIANNDNIYSTYCASDKQKTLNIFVKYSIRSRRVVNIIDRIPS